MTLTFIPPDGYRNTTSFPTKPASETAFRDSMQDLLDQVRDYMNASLATKTSEAWNAPTLLNGWVNFGGASNPSIAGYYKDDVGIVRLRGLLKSGTTTAGTVIFNLGAGYRPALEYSFPVICGSGASEIIGRVSVSASGTVNIQSGANTFLSLDSISFRGEQ